MLIYPAIDLYAGKAVRLFKGDYSQMTVYHETPAAVALDFVKKGATQIHLVDLEGARTGTTPNLDTVLNIKRASNVFCEIGGGVRTMAVIETYLSAGVDRVILGTAAVTQPSFAEEAVKAYGARIALGIDIRDGRVAIKGWTEQSELNAMDFARRMQDIGVQTLICTDISKDGAMQGTNHTLYQQLSEQLSINVIASGGVSSLADVERLAKLNLHGAIIGKAYYTGAIDLSRAIEVAK